jgi:phosphatidylserine/phosphatidylglycerophosphate/cardiolipin synthase-like enzyme
VGCGRSSESSGGVVAATANMHLPRIGHTQTRLLDGRVLIVGGLQTVRGMLPPANNDVEIFDPAEGRFRVVAQMKTVRIMHADTLLADGRTVFTGGTPGRKVDVFDPRTGKLEAPGALRGSRAAHTATLLADGRILLVGGFSQTVTYHDAAFHQESKYLNSMEVYDPRSGSARVLKCSLNAPRRGHTASLLGDGRVLIIGGTGLKRTELIDVASESVT